MLKLERAQEYTVTEAFWWMRQDIILLSKNVIYFIHNELVTYSFSNPLKVEK
jgi:hypothetical protein